MCKKYSVCIINWNWLAILKASIKRLKKEPYDMEIIVLDNGSKDGSGNWLREQVGIKTILLPRNKGSSVGRNLMLDEAKGKYIFLLDSDILYIPGSLEVLEAILNKLHDEGKPDIKAVGLNPNHFVNDMRQYSEVPIPSNIAISDFSPNFIPTQYGLFEREVFDKCRFDENFGVGWGGEDDDLCMQMREYGWGMAYVDHLYFHAKNSEKWHAQHNRIKHTIKPRRKYLKNKWK